MKHVLTLLAAIVTLTSSASLPDNSVVPVVVTPAQSSINAGQSTSVSITFDRAATSNTTVNLSSSNSAVLRVLSTTTLLSGQSTATFTATAPQSIRALRSTSVTLTATCNGSSASGTVTVN